MNDASQVAIIGSGPAGYTAAIYTARAGLNPVVFEGVPSGGALMQTTEVENFPGFPEGIQGPELMEAMRAQAERFGARFTQEDATTLTGEAGAWTIGTGSRLEDAQAVILAMGSRYRMLELPNESRLLGHGVSACATCDGFFFRGQDVVVVGGGDSAMEEATFLTRFARTVTVIHRRNELRASAIMADRALRNPQIKFVWNSVVDDVLGKDAVTGVLIRELPTGAQSTIECGGVFVAIGHEPRSDLARDLVDVDDEGYVRTVGGTTQTTAEGLFACGDLVDHRYRQAITAAGSGCAAALDVERWLSAHAYTFTTDSMTVAAS